MARQRVPAAALELRVRRQESAVDDGGKNRLYRTDRRRQRGQRQMKRRTYCVYNQTRECFISLGVTPADTTFARLRGLIGRLELKFDDGVWVVPSRGIHTLG